MTILIDAMNILMCFCFGIFLYLQSLEEFESPKWRAWEAGIVYWTLFLLLTSIELARIFIMLKEGR